MIAAEGTSIITPSWTDEATAEPSRASRARTDLEPRPRRIDLLARRDHRQHHPQLAPGGRLEQRRELVVEQVRAPQAQAQAAHAERGVRLDAPADCHSAGLSPPTSSVRKTTGRSPMTSRIRA